MYTVFRTMGFLDKNIDIFLRLSQLKISCLLNPSPSPRVLIDPILRSIFLTYFVRENWIEGARVHY